MVCKFCRFRTDDTRTTCPKCGATLTGGKIEEVHEESQVVEEATNQPPTPETIENFTNEFQHQFNNAKNRAVKFIILLIIIVAIIFGMNACNNKKDNNTKNDSFTMEVTDAFSSVGKGTVITGKITKGTVNVGDEVTVNGKKVKVKSIEKFRSQTESASEGESIGLAVDGIDMKDVKAGTKVTK